MKLALLYRGHSGMRKEMWSRDRQENIWIPALRLTLRMFLVFPEPQFWNEV